MFYSAVDHAYHINTYIYTYNVIYVDQIIMYNCLFIYLFLFCFTNVHNEITLLYMDDSDEFYDSRSSKTNKYLKFS